MAIKPVKKDCLTLLQERYNKFWTKFNAISACDENFAKNFKTHTIASIRGYQDYSVGKPYRICIKINFDKERVTIQSYFQNLVIYEDMYLHHRDRIERMIGKRLEWKEMTTKAYALLDLNMPIQVSDMKNWDDVCKEIIPNAILMKEVFEMF